MQIDNETYEAYKDLASGIMIAVADDYRESYRQWLNGKLTNYEYVTRLKVEQSNQAWYEFLLSYLGGYKLKEILTNIEKSERLRYEKSNHK